MILSDENSIICWRFLGDFLLVFGGTWLKAKTLGTYIFTYPFSAAGPKVLIKSSSLKCSSQTKYWFFFGSKESLEPFRLYLFKTSIHFFRSGSFVGIRKNDVVVCSPSFLEEFLHSGTQQYFPEEEEVAFLLHVGCSSLCSLAIFFFSHSLLHANTYR